MARIFAVFAAVTLAGCMSPLTTKPVTSAVYVKAPQEGKIVQASVGDSIYEEGDFAVYKSAVVATSFKWTSFYTVHIEGNKLLYSKLSDGQEAYCGTATLTSTINGQKRGACSLSWRSRSPAEV